MLLLGRGLGKSPYVVGSGRRGARTPGVFGSRPVLGRALVEIFLELGGSTVVEHLEVAASWRLEGRAARVAGNGRRTANSLDNAEGE